MQLMQGGSSEQQQDSGCGAPPAAHAAAAGAEPSPTQRPSSSAQIRATAHPLVPLVDWSGSDSLGEVWDLPYSTGGYPPQTAHHVLPQLLLTSGCAEARHWATVMFVPEALQTLSPVTRPPRELRCAPLPPIACFASLCALGAKAEAELALQMAEQETGGHSLRKETRNVPFTSGLLLAANQGHTDVVSWLVADLGVPVDSLGGVGYMTALHAAAFGGHLEAMQVLLEAGASTAFVMPNGYEGGSPAMNHACAGGHLAAVQWLFDRGVPLYQPPPSDHVRDRHAVFDAVTRDHADVAVWVAQHCPAQELDLQLAICSLPPQAVNAVIALHSAGFLSHRLQQLCVQRADRSGSQGCLQQLLDAGFEHNT